LEFFKLKATRFGANGTGLPPGRPLGECHDVD
jgi:hypothetical protein